MLSAFDNFGRMGLAVASLGPSLPKTPTTLNPATVGSDVSLSNGNLTATANNIDMPSNAASLAFSTASHTSGKYYWEAKINAFLQTGFIFNGIGNASTQTVWNDANGIGFTNNSNGWVKNGASTGVGAPNFNVGDVLGFAADFSAKLIWVIDWSFVTPHWNNSAIANPASGVGGASFSTVTGPYFAVVGLFQGGGTLETFNFGVQPLTGTMPNGFGFF